MPTSPLSRNQPCSCGSSRKFKHCCAGKSAAPQAPDDLTTDIDVQIGVAMALHRDKHYAQAITRPTSVFCSCSQTMRRLCICSA